MSVLEPTLPGVSQYRTHVPIKVTNVQLISPQVVSPPSASSGDDGAYPHDVLLKGMSVFSQSKSGKLTCSYCNRHTRNFMMMMMMMMKIHLFGLACGCILVIAYAVRIRTL